MNIKKHPSLEYLKELIDFSKKDECIDFFGGEPLLYPHFWELLEHAANRGHPVSLATNARAFKSYDMAKRISQFNLSIRSSLYGHNPEIHDRLTRSRGSFEETIRGIANLISAKCDLCVNIVMLQENVRYLLDITELLLKTGVKEIKFSTVIDCSRSLSSIPAFDDVRMFLDEAIRYAIKEDAKIMIEKSPLCLTNSYISQHVPETDIAMVSTVSSIFAKLDVCHRCILNNECIGIDRNYAAKHGDRGLLPFSKYPEEFIEMIDVSDLDKYVPKHYTNFLVLRLSNLDISAENVIRTAKAQKKIDEMPGCHLLGCI